MAAYCTEAAAETFWTRTAQPLGQDTFVVLAGQLSAWVLDDLTGETSESRG